MKGNLLINETSLYLLQHAKNPVNWEPWTDNSFKRAKEENKMVLVSIGYSSCHWCHVMEHESFEDEEVAEFMNKNFICIKVDREERPDIDHLYMNAVQLMGVNGGWPLNCFVLPDGRPIYGGTYFRKEEWLRVLKALASTYHKEKEKVFSFADNLELELKNQNIVGQKEENQVYSEHYLKKLIKVWEQNFDKKQGGYSYVPKFPMPNSLLSLYHYSLGVKDETVLEFLNTTLRKISFGGMFDHVDGGFARYSTDAIWKVPHFEKMLYDNAQLMELYSELFSLNGEKEYENVVEKTFKWLKAELKTNYGSYRCAQDADSEGEEGAFYCWTDQELRAILKNDFEWFSSYFGISNSKKWESDKYILYKNMSLSEFASIRGWSIDEFQQKLKNTLHLLSVKRSERKKPEIDTKSLTSWNALLIKALIKSYLAFQNENYLEEAKEISNWIIDYQLKKNGALCHNFVNGSASIDGFLNDYSFTIDAFILLYQVSGEIKWLEYSKNLMEKVDTDFNSVKHDLYYFSNSKSKLISRKIEIEDDVIPSSNSVLANCFFQLGIYFRRDDWVLQSKKMLSCVIDKMELYPMSYSNWFHLYSKFVFPCSEISFLQEKEGLNHQDLKSLIKPMHVISYHTSIPMSKEFKEGIFVCKSNTCLPKIGSIEELLSVVNE